MKPDKGNTGNILNLNAFGDIIDKPKKDKTNLPGAGEPTEEPIKAIDPAGSFSEPNSNTPTFSDISKNSKGKAEACECVAKEVLKHRSQIRLLHWQTHSYAEHKTLDALEADFFVLADNLMETIIGKYERPHIQKDPYLELTNYRDIKPKDLFNVMANTYRHTCKTKFDRDKDSEILNILDEIIALCEKGKYLFTLE